MLRFKQFLSESTEFYSYGDSDYERSKKPVVRPSKLSIDPASKELSHDFAVFPETEEELKKISDEEIVKRFEPYRERYRQHHPDWAKELDDIEDRARRIPDLAPIKDSQMAKRIRQLVTFHKAFLDLPNSYDPTEFGRTRLITDPKVPPSDPKHFWFIPERPTDQPPVPHRWRHSHEYRTVETPKYGKVMQKGAEVAGKAGKFLPFIGLPLAGMAITQRAQAGDYIGAGLEAASEVADSVPVLGTPISAGIQGYLGYHDMTPEEQENFRKNRGAKPTEQSRRKAEETYSRQNY